MFSAQTKLHQQQETAVLLKLAVKRFSVWIRGCLATIGDASRVSVETAETLSSAVLDVRKTPTVVFGLEQVLSK